MITSIIFRILFILSFFSFTFSGLQDYKLLSKSTHGSLSICIYKNLGYKGKDLENLFKIECLHQDKTKNRAFYIKKSNAALQAKSLSNFALVSPTLQGELRVYPFGWESEKIFPREIQETCIAIITNNIQPI